MLGKDGPRNIKQFHGNPIAALCSCVFAGWASQLECVPVKHVLQRYAEGEVTKGNQLSEYSGKKLQIYSTIKSEQRQRTT